MSEPDAARGSLWVRYVDWCSAQVARRLLELSPEEFWERAERQAQTEGSSLPLTQSVVPLARQLAMELSDYDWYLTLYDYWQKHGKSDSEIDRRVEAFRDLCTIPALTPLYSS